MLTDAATKALPLPIPPFLHPHFPHPPIPPPSYSPHLLHILWHASDSEEVIVVAYVAL